MRSLMLCALWLASLAQGGEMSVAAVDFAPSLEQRMHQQYGPDEAATLRAAIATAVARATGAETGRCTVGVTVRDAVPTHPTRQQVADNPSLDVRRTRYVGGAALAAEVRHGDQGVLQRVTYSYYAPSLGLGSRSVDRWADARLAIEGFARKLAAACRQAPAARAVDPR